MDGTDAALERYARPGWREWEALWLSDEISSRECLSHQVALLQADRPALERLAAELPVDPGFIDLAKGCMERSIPFTILSDGLDVLIAAVLRRLGLSDVPFQANSVRWDADGKPFLLFPNAADRCERGAGHCKCLHPTFSRATGNRTIYIGDGRSDFCVSEKVHFVYAKRDLAAWCRKKALPYHQIESLSDVPHHLFSTESRIP